MRHIVVLRSAAELETIRPAWQQLQDSRYTLFQSFAWNQLAARAFARTEQPYVVYVENDGGAALIPAALARDGAVTFLGESLFDYRDVLWAGDEEPLWTAWSRIAELQRPLRLTALRGAPDHPWATFDPQPFCSAPGVSRSDMDAGAFAAAHHRLGRYLRRLHREGVSLQRHTGAASELIRTIYQRKAQQLASAPNNLFANRARVEFMVAAAALEPDACTVFTLERDSSLVAALVTFRDAGVRRFYTICFDQKWAHFSPGTTLCYEATRLSLAEGLDCDYMTGEQPHKLRLATTAVPLFRVDAGATDVSDAVARRFAPQLAA